MSVGSYINNVGCIKSDSFSKEACSSILDFCIIEKLCVAAAFYSQCGSESNFVRIYSQ